MTFWGYVGLLFIIGLMIEQYQFTEHELELKKLRITLLAEKNIFEMSDKEFYDDLTENNSWLYKLSRKCAALRRDPDE